MLVTGVGYGAAGAEGLGGLAYVGILLYGWPIIHLLATGLSVFVFAIDSTKFGEILKYTGLLVAFQVLSVLIILVLTLVFNSLVARPYGPVLGALSFYLISLPTSLVLMRAKAKK